VEPCNPRINPQNKMRCFPVRAIGSYRSIAISRTTTRRGRPSPGCSVVFEVFVEPDFFGDHGLALGDAPTCVACLLPDTEIAEDDVEQIFDIDGTGDAAEAAQGETEIFGAELGQGGAERAPQG
jgi:hypothetical protein